MASSTSFEQNYLASGLVPPPAGKGQLAGLIYRLRQLLLAGYSPVLAHQLVDQPDNLAIVNAASEMTGLPNLKADYLAVDSP